MSINYYDDAFAAKIKAWVKDPNLRILKPDETTRLWNIIADESGDKGIRLPLVALSRDSTIEILEVAKQPRTFSGYKMKRNEEGTIQLNAIPIRLGYQIDIYTKGIEEACEYVRNFVFNLVNYPKLSIEIPYNSLNMMHDSNIHLEASIMDNSSIQEKLFPDQFQRFTLKVVVDDAYLFNAPRKLNISIESAAIEIIDKNTEDVEKVLLTTKLKE